MQVFPRHCLIFPSYQRRRVGKKGVGDNQKEYFSIGLLIPIYLYVTHKSTQSKSTLLWNIGITTYTVNVLDSLQTSLQNCNILYLLSLSDLPTIKAKQEKKMKNLNQEAEIPYFQGLKRVVHNCQQEEILPLPRNQAPATFIPFFCFWIYLLSRSFEQTYHPHQSPTKNSLQH